MPTIDRLFAYLAFDDEGEGLVQWPSAGGLILPLVGADLARIESIRWKAQAVADVRGRDVRLVLFEHRRELEVLRPGSRDPRSS